MKSDPTSVLVVCTRRIGDVLLSTPLIRSLRHAWPRARIEALVLPGTEGILKGNTDLDAVLLTPKGDWQAWLSFLRTLWRRYDLALAATGSDRARYLARWAGRHCLGLWARKDPARGRWLLPGHWVDFDEVAEHAIESPLRLAAALGVARLREVVPPRPAAPLDLARLVVLAEGQAVAPARTVGGRSDGPGRHEWPDLRKGIAVVHPWPKFAYKAWPRERWLGLARALSLDGLQVVLTGGPDADEVAFCERLAQQVPGSLSLAGACSFGEFAELIRQARVFIGPDTVMTHLAAAVGTPTVALFGPSNPVRWGPWPAALREAGSPWPFKGSGHAGRVWLVQGEGSCVPCLLEGCERNVTSTSRCLQELPLARVIQAVAQALATQQD